MFVYFLIFSVFLKFCLLFIHTCPILCKRKGTPRNIFNIYFEHFKHFTFYILHLHFTFHILNIFYFQIVQSFLFFFLFPNQSFKKFYEFSIKQLQIWIAYFILSLLIV